jgi:hypothetical protein
VIPVTVNERTCDQAKENVRAEVDFTRSVYKSASQALVQLGFEQRPERTFSYDLGSEDVLGWVGFQRSQSDSDHAFELYPDVGVHHRAIETLRSELVPGKEARFGATVGTNVGYVLPVGRYAGWYFHPGQDNEVVAHDLAASVLQGGLPYMERLKDINALIEALRERGSATEYRVPIALLAAGRVGEALLLVEETSSELEGTTGDWTEFYTEFAARFRAAAKQSE